MSTIEYETETLKVKVSVDYQRNPRKGRAYVWPTEQPSLPMPGFDDSPETKKAWRAYNRQEIIIRKRVLKDVIEGLIEREILPADMHDELVQASFSRKAGCGCGCSPGFIFNEGCMAYTEIYATVKAPKPERTFTYADFDLQEA